MVATYNFGSVYKNEIIKNDKTRITESIMSVKVG